MKISTLMSSVTLAITCLVVVIALYLGAETLWYSKYDFAFLHQWGISPEGIQAKFLVLVGLIGIGIIGIAVQILKRIFKPRKTSRNNDASEACDK